jgi:membrane protease YdiL (CAAX protease family)
MRLLPTAIKVYSVLTLVSLIWIRLQKRLTLDLFLTMQWEPFLKVLLMGLGAAGFLIGLFLYSIRNFLWARQLEAELSRILVPIRPWENAIISLLSGFAEELFFRGALQPVIGLIPASLLFGCAHFVPRSPFWPWALQAVFAGFLLGSLYELTHFLYPVMVAHSVTNFVLILIMNRQYSTRLGLRE